MNLKSYQKSESCVFLTLSEAVQEFNLSAGVIDRLAKECGAKLKVGRSARYDREALQKHIESFRTT